MDNIKIVEVEVNQDTVNYIESLDYEQSARKDIITFMLQNNMNINTDSFKQYQKEQSEFYISFQTAKQELEQQYLPPEWKGHQVNWNLDYSTGVLKFEKFCEC